MTRSAKSSTGAVARTTVVVEIDEVYCKGCGLCVAFCERGVLEQASVPDSKGVYLARVVAPKSCRGCRRCVLVCPDAAIRLRRP
ncbi:MAG: 4Fe-4S dicluster domain-containing protein [Candidatus Brocadiia bacterium]